MLEKIQFALALVLFGVSLSSRAEESEKMPAYNRSKIIVNRFGDNPRQEAMIKIGTVRQAISNHLAGQDDLAIAIQARLFQYYNSLGTRTKEPVALHFLGLAGVGKTSIIEVLKELGFPIVKLDAQNYPGGNSSGSSEYRLGSALRKALETRKSPNDPLILFIDELDKAPELDLDGKEESQPVITSLNTILSEGQVFVPQNPLEPLQFSNVFILTAMNFSPRQISEFSQEILGQKKSFWEFTEDDMLKLDKTIRSGESNHSSVARMLAMLFRANTVSRLIPDALVAKVLDSRDFDQIVNMSVEEVVGRIQKKEGSGLKVTLTPTFVQFLRDVSVYSPAGARMPIKRVDLLIEQLLGMALHTNLGTPASLALPRSVQIDFDPSTQNANLKVVAFKRHRTQRQIAAQGELQVRYVKAIGSFEFPRDGLDRVPEDLKEKATAHQARKESRPLSREKVAAARMNLNNDHSLENHLNSVIFNQPELAKKVDEDLHLYLKSQDRRIYFQTIYGFSGVGKSAITLAAAKKLDLPVAKLNMQQYSSSAPESADSFGEDLFQRLQEARDSAKGGKAILLIEELDKAFEVDDKGDLIVRPALAIIKDLLNDGSRSITIKTAFGSSQKTIDIRGVYVMITMNFPTKRFNLKADPRATTIEDLELIYDQISRSPQSVRNILASLFGQDTVNRLMSGSVLMARPLSRQGYMNILKAQLTEALTQVNSNPLNSNHHVALTVNPSDAYLSDYLFAESVIPSEGGRQAAKSALQYLTDDLMAAIQALPKRSPIYNLPLQIDLDYRAPTSSSPPRVLARAELSRERDRLRMGGPNLTELFDRQKNLRFPPMREFGQLTPSRLLLAAHEFGHAYGAVMFGTRFEFATVLNPPGPSVKMRKNDYPTGRALLSRLLVSLASRPLERLVLDTNPLDPNSVLSITSGSRQDVKDATGELWDIVHALGLDPGGGTIERAGLGGPDSDLFERRRYFTAPLSEDKTDRLGFVLRDLENFVLAQFLRAHTKEWWVEHITEFAERGGLKESEFYDLIGHPFPGENADFLGEDSNIFTIFAERVVGEPESVKTARAFRQGETKSTVAENLDEALAFLKSSLKAHLHPCSDLLSRTEPEAQ